jgi:hypothetical protein
MRLFSGKSGFCGYPLARRLHRDEESDDGKEIIVPRFGIGCDGDKVSGRQHHPSFTRLL